MFSGREYNQIINLIKFNVNFTRSDINGNYPISSSPDYIMEKYIHWIGEMPIVEHKMYTPDDMTDFFNKYWKIWRPETKDLNNKFKNILMYLQSTKHLEITDMIKKFQEYIGPIDMISDIPDKKGLHPIMQDFVKMVVEKNEHDLYTILRDMKIKNITQ